MKWINTLFIIDKFDVITSVELKGMYFDISTLSQKYATWDTWKCNMIFVNSVDREVYACFFIFITNEVADILQVFLFVSKKWALDLHLVHFPH